MTFHAVSNTALSEWKHNKVLNLKVHHVAIKLVSQKKESMPNHWNESFLKTNPKPFHVDITMKY